MKLGLVMDVWLHMYVLRYVCFWFCVFCIEEDLVTLECVIRTQTRFAIYLTHKHQQRYPETWQKKLFVLHCVLSHKLSSVKIMCLMSFQNGLWCVQTWFYFSFKTHLGKYRCFAAAWEYIWSYIMFSTTLRIRRSLCL